MNLMDLFIKIGVDDQASRQVSSISQKLGNGLKTAAKIGTAAVAAAGTGITAFLTKSVQAYADYEQLVGGVETLFKESAGKVKGYADQAYKAANMSANQYMETVTSFSASLLQGLNNDTAKAADIANKAIIDMSDNANKMGTDMSLIQNAYQGFAKQNYTMLDNLKLGYGGTASEMARLINDSGVLGETTKVTAKTINNVSFDKIIEAIGVIQEKMGITGATADEAATTISGSIATAKAALENWLVSLSNGTDDTGKKFDTLVSSVGTVVDNLTPAISTAISNIDGLVSSFADEFINAGETEDTFVDVGYNYLHEIMGGMIEELDGEESKSKLVQFLGKLGAELTDENNLNTFFLDAKVLAMKFIDSMSEMTPGAKGGLNKMLDNIAAILSDPEQLEASEKLGLSLGHLIASVFDIGDQDVSSIGDKIGNAIYAGAKNGEEVIKGAAKAIAESFKSEFEQTVSDSGWVSALMKVLFKNTPFGTLYNWFMESVESSDLFTPPNGKADNGIKENIKSSKEESIPENAPSYFVKIPIEELKNEGKDYYTTENKKEIHQDVQIIIKGADSETAEELAHTISAHLQRLLEEREASESAY